MNQTTEIKLIQIYYFVCEIYDKCLKYLCQRFSNNNTEPKFTDQEIITIYLFCVGIEGRYKIKEMHKFIQDYWETWFQNIPSYQAFIRRLNRLSEAL